MKIEVLTDELNTQLRGQHVKEEKLRAVLSEAVSKTVVSKLAGGGDGDPTQHTLVLLTMACQMLWNELEDARAEIEWLKTEVDEAFDHGYLEGSLETEHSMQENS